MTFWCRRPLLKEVETVDAGGCESQGVPGTCGLAQVSQYFNISSMVPALSDLVRLTFRRWPPRSNVCGDTPS